MTSGTDDGSRKTLTEERVDGFLRSLSERRRRSIRKSLERPLKVEALRTIYVGGCILLDLVLLPIALVSFLGRAGLIAAVILILLLGYLQLRVHNLWFGRRRKTAPSGPTDG